VIGTQRCSLPDAGRFDEAIFVNRHGHGLTNLEILAKNGILEVDNHDLEVGGVGIDHQLVVRQVFVYSGLADIEEPGRGDRAGLEIFEDRILTSYRAEDNFIEVR
jgi:hypothetical protein